MIEAISADSVLVAGQLVKRPINVGRSEWMSFWENVRGWDLGELRLITVKQYEF